MAGILPDGNPAPGKLTTGQVAQWAIGGGFGGLLTIANSAATGGQNPVVVATAVGMAESGGNPDATHHNADGSVDYGVWQINSKAHAALFTTYPDWWSSSNANMAFEVYTGGGNSFSPWTAYKSGAYLAFMPAAEVAVATAGDGQPTAQGTVTTNNPLANAANGILGVAQGFFKAGTWLSSRANWGRIALVGIGAAALIGALAIIAKPAVDAVTPMAQAAVTGVGKVVSRGDTESGSDVDGEPESPDES